MLLAADTIVVSRATTSAPDPEAGETSGPPAIGDASFKKSMSGDAVALAVRDAYSGLGQAFPQSRRTTDNNEKAFKYFYGPSW